MRWVRANLWIGSRRALFALALQMVLSFSHVHLDDLNTGLRSAATVHSDGQSGDASGNQPSAPNRELLCPICLLIRLAGATLHPAPPALVLPEPMRWTPPAIAAAIASDCCHLSFNARAPPTA